jgi:ribosome-binding protein aMBF1 (putative translation factor)
MVPVTNKSKEDRVSARAQQAEILWRIGARIRRETNGLGLSLGGLAGKVGISEMTLHRIKTGNTSPYGVFS